MNGKLLIGDKWVETKEKIASKNPATLEPVGEACLASSDDCREAVRAASKAFPLWRGMPFMEKQKIFRKAKDILLERSDEVARLLTLEKGSPLAESMSVEVLSSLETLDYYAHSLSKSVRPKKTKPHVPLFAPKKSFYHFHPLGVTLIVSPWNFPFLIPICDMVSALSAGNTIVLRPSTTTPLVALLIGEIFVEAGLPPGVLNIVICRVPQAEEMITNPAVQTIMFTGSVATGKRIMELASRNLTNLVLELGGKDPMIVLKDADVERASRGAVWAGFMNTGQSCASVERVYVAREVEARFMEKVLELAKQLNVGNPLEPGVDMGPMTNLDQLQLVEEHIRDAKEKGALVLCGGERLKNLPGYFLTPAVLNRVNHTMKIMTEETFGPVLPIMPFSDIEEAISLANDSRYGLTASVWSRDRKMASLVAERLEVGSVTINDHMFSFTEPKAIWGGIKQTGMGRSHGPFGLLHLVNIKYISSDFVRKKGQLWWYPYTAPMPEIIRKSLILLHHRSLKEKFKTALALVPSFSMVKSASPLKSLLRIASRFLRR